MDPYKSEAFGLFHMLWSRTPTGPTYKKEDWKLVEDLVTEQRCDRTAAIRAFDRLVRAAKAGDGYIESDWLKLATHLKLRKHVTGE